MRKVFFKTLLATIIGSVLLTGCGSGSGDNKPVGLVNASNPSSQPTLPRAATGEAPAGTERSESTATDSSLSSSLATERTETGEHAVTSPNSSDNASNGVTPPATESLPSVSLPAIPSLSLALLSLPSSFIDTGAAIEDTVASEEEKVETVKKEKQPTTKEIDGKQYTIPELPDRTISKVTEGAYGKYWVTYRWDNTGAYQTLPWRPGFSDEELKERANREAPPVTKDFDLSTVSDRGENNKITVADKVRKKILADLDKNAAARSSASTEDEKYVLGYGIMSGDTSSKLPVKIGEDKQTIKVGSTADVDLVKTVDVYSFLNDKTNDTQFLLGFGADSGSYLGGSRSDDTVTLYAFGDKATQMPSADLSYRGKAVVSQNGKYHIGEFAGSFSTSAKTFNGMIQGGDITEPLTLSASGISSATYSGTVTCSSCENVKFDGQFNGKEQQGTTGVIYTSSSSTSGVSSSSNGVFGVYGGAKVDTPKK